MTPRRGAGALLLLALVFAACGGPSKEEYEKQVLAINDRVQRASDLSENAPTTSQELVAGLERTQKAANEAADDFAALQVPDDATEPHARTLRGIRRTSDDLSPIIEAARSGDLQLLRRRLLGGFPSKATRDLLTSAQKLYRDAGYNVAATNPESTP